MYPRHLYPKHIAWIGSLALGLLACASDDGSDGPTPPAFGTGVAGGSSAGGVPNVGSGGQVGAVPSTGSGGSTNESGIPVAGGIATAGSGGSGATSAAADAGTPPLLGAPDAGAVTPPDGTVVGGPVGPGPSSLPAPPGAADVPRPSGVPGDTVTILNWAGYTGAVTYSFDDNNQSQITNYDTLNALDVPFTFFLQTNKASASDPVWPRALLDGHEIGNHTQSHNTQACTPADINAATQFIQNNLGVQPLTFAAPEGNICFKAAATGLFFINRGTGPAQPVMPNDNSDPLNLNCYIPGPDQQTAAFNNNVNDGQAQGGWVIYVIHGFTGDTTAYLPGEVGALTGAIQYTKSLGDMWIGTMVDVGSYWLGQRAFMQATRTQDGDALTWTWNLPGQFPPGKYIRARVPGGTLTQGGQPLTWDPHGYYEIALDARSVTLTP